MDCLLNFVYDSISLPYGKYFLFDGSAIVHGREIKDWDWKCLRSQITILKSDELDYSIQAG
jgi:hypothetical protein